MSDVVMIKLRVGGEIFEVEKETLLRVKGTYFHGLLSSGAWQPQADGAYTIDRSAIGFDRIIEYLRSGKLRVEGMTELEKDCMYSNLDYLIIPYNWKYESCLLIEGFNAFVVCELSDGRLCGSYGNDGNSPLNWGSDIIVWNLDSSAIEMTLKGHTSFIRQVLQLQDGRICSLSNDDDNTIKIWNIDSGLCECNLTTIAVSCIIQLFDGRICSGSSNGTIQVWNVSTRVCESTMIAQLLVVSLAQLPDGRICGGNTGGTISIHNFLNGKCEISWKVCTYGVHAIVCIDATRVCCGSDDNTIKVWNTDTGECVRTLEGHANRVAYSVLLMQDGRLCSASYQDGIIKVWNLDTGECETTLNIDNAGVYGLLQLSDGRLLSNSGRRTVHIWSR